MKPYLKKGVQLAANTSINQTLEIKGEEARTFLKNFSEIFHVNISQFDFDRYFSENIENDESLTIEALSRSIALGSLDEMTINFIEDGSEFKPKYTLNKILLGVFLFIACAILLFFVAFYS